jgi:ribosomal protein S18 acetylase RimI-like enzyme
VSDSKNVRWAIEPNSAGKFSLDQAKQQVSTDVGYVVDLAKRNSEAISFIPSPRLEQYYENGQILVARENDEPCGFLVFGLRPVAKIYQACIQYDARRMENGLRLVSRLIRIASSRGCDAISLWCASDLEANHFWRAAGFRFVDQRPGGSRRGRVHNRWYMQLTPTLFVYPHEAGRLDPRKRSVVRALEEVPTNYEGCPVAEMRREAGGEK